MTALDLEFERAPHNHNEGYDSDNDYDLPGPFIRPVHIYLISTTEDSLHSSDYRRTQGTTSPSTQKWTKERVAPMLSSLLMINLQWETLIRNGLWQWRRIFSTAELNDPVYSEEPLPDRQWLCIHLLLHSSITGHTLGPATPPLQPIQEEVPPEAELMDVPLPDDLPDIINVPEEELHLDYESWVWSMFRNQ